MKNFEFIRRRSAIARAVRHFFEEHGFVEVSTPVMISAPAQEEYIEAIRAGQDKFLRPSPEMAMKTLLAEGAEKIFELGSCFRSGEHGWKHREEFTMLEYYRKNSTYRQLLDFTAEMIRAAAGEANGTGCVVFRGETIDLAAAPEIITVREAFRRYSRYTAEEAMRRDVFDEETVLHIEPELGRGRMSFLIDYPAERASLARLKKEDPSLAERWELYIAGVELANAYGELADAAEQKKRFAAAAAFRRAHHMAQYPENTEFFAALEKGIGECSGAALGFDRLVMILAGAEEIGDVMI